MNANYRKELAFSFEALDAATTAYKKLVRWVEEHNTETGTIHEGYKEKFLSAIYDDLGTPQAVAEIWNMLKDETLSLGDKYATLLLMSEVLGLGLEHVTKEKISLPQEVSQLLTERKIAREEKNFQASDILRDKIQKLGYLVKDTKDGQIISKI
jgi:cysteinyl-tRNA synthetase